MTSVSLDTQLCRTNGCGNEAARVDERHARALLRGLCELDQKLTARRVQQQLRDLDDQHHREDQANTDAGGFIDPDLLAEALRRATAIGLGNTSSHPLVHAVQAYERLAAQLRLAATAIEEALERQ